jgi:GMP synthase PP-ATPase subunit
MSVDIVEELRFEDNLCVRAAEEIERLRIEVLRLHNQILRKELEEIRNREALNWERVRG